MANDQVQQTNAESQQPPAQQSNAPASTPRDAASPPHEAQSADDFDGLEGKKPDELTPEELRLMADTMPGEGPGD